MMFATVPQGRCLFAVVCFVRSVRKKTGRLAKSHNQWLLTGSGRGRRASRSCNLSNSRIDWEFPETVERVLVRRGKRGINRSLAVPIDGATGPRIVAFFWLRTGSLENETGVVASLMSAIWNRRLESRCTHAHPFVAAVHFFFARTHLLSSSCVVNLRLFYFVSIRNYLDSFFLTFLLVSFWEIVWARG